MTKCESARQAIVRGGALSPECERHLFICPRCQKLARAERILGLLSERFRQANVIVPDDFVRRVMGRVIAGRRLPAALTRWVAAAVLALSFAAGFAYATLAQRAQQVDETATGALAVSTATNLTPLGF